MERERTAVLRILSEKKSELEKFLNKDLPGSTPKSSEISEASRKEGDDLFLQKGHDANTHKQIFHQYCKSVITAPDRSNQLALSYESRSAFLLHIKKYKDCINDCNRALEIINFGIFKVKMLCRKAECLKKLKLSQSEDVLKEAENYRSKISIDDKNDKLLIDLISKVKVMSISGNDSAKNDNFDVQTDEMLDGISIKYNQKYGRHLVATKDYNPGDIILVEKLFATTASPRMYCTNCHYCLKTCWSGVPCRDCDWVIFCSEGCRDKAWKLFHNVECSLVPFLIMADQEYKSIDTAIRAVIIGIREAGSVAQLRADLNSIDESTADVGSKGFFKDQQYTKNKIESVYVLNSDRLLSSKLESVALAALMALIGIVKFNKLVCNIDVKDIENLVINEEFIFLGTLITKLAAIRETNDYEFSPNYMYECEESNTIDQCRQESCCIRGSCFSPISSLISHHCYPNAGRCFTEDRKAIVFAVQRIKKNTQIFISYFCEFDDVPLSQRKLSLQKYHISCDCQPCIESWPPILQLSEQLLEKYNCDISSALENKLYDECSHIFDALNEMSVNFNKQDIKILSKTILQASEIKQPSLLMSYLLESLKRVFSHVYGLKLRTFGECNFE